MSRFSDHKLVDDINVSLIMEGKDIYNERGDLLRTDIWTNAPHLVVQHSPDGFNFGYGGSGPADLALNVVEWIIRNKMDYRGVKDRKIFNVTWNIHQEFKWKFISTADAHSRTEIPMGDLIDFVKKQVMALDPANVFEEVSNG